MVLLTARSGAQNRQSDGIGHCWSIGSHDLQTFHLGSVGDIRQGPGQPVVVVRHRVCTTTHAMTSTLATTHTADAYPRSFPSASPCSLAPGSVAIIIGTRPEAIKLAEVVRLLGPAAEVIHTGQHYSGEMWADVAAEVGLSSHSSPVEVGARTRSAQIGMGVAALGDFLRIREFDVVVVHGDTNATLAGALAANSEGIPLVHVESGLRSHDRGMPEEHNRVLVDHLADLCLAPTASACVNLAAENIDGPRVRLTGNTIVEVVTRLLPDRASRLETCIAHGVRPDSFVLATLHRPENTDNPAQLRAILEDLRSLDVPVVLPLHPRTRKLADPSWLSGLRVTEPLQPRAFLALLKEAALVVSDSGGLQEEVTVLGQQALIVRRSTERPESLVDWCELVQPDGGLRERASARLADLQGWRQRCSRPSPFGDGTASEQTVSAISELVAAAGEGHR
jgi:UDP-N-acetylglucosamine 2-epimerase (non-hydrolysing)